MLEPAPMKELDQKWIQKKLKELKKNPNSSAYAPLADTMRRAGHFKTAEKISRQGIKHLPKKAENYICLGQTLYDQGEYEKSRKILSQAVKLEPGNILTLRLLGEIFIQLKEPKNALKIYEMISIYCPDNKAVQNLKEKLNSFHFKDYDRFTVQTLSQISKQIQIEKMPAIRPKQFFNPHP